MRQSNGLQARVVSQLDLLQLVAAQVDLADDGQIVATEVVEFVVRKIQFLQFLQFVGVEAADFVSIQAQSGQST